jgi:subtilisin family serine protease
MLTYAEPSTQAASPIARSLDFSQETRTSNLLDLVNLTPLMELTSGRPEIIIGLVDGPVVIGHPDLAGENVREIPGRIGGACVQASSLACMHGTFVAGILCAKRSSAAPAICPGCTLLVRPIFSETQIAEELIPSATPEELAAAIIECIDAGARLVNLSAALAQVPSAKGERALGQALDYAANRGVIVVAAAGNQGTVGSTAITRHPWVIAVIACDRRGRPVNESNFGNSIGRRGLSAPGEGITSLGTDSKAVPSGGTSVAAPFVTGAIALVWSEFPDAGAGQVRLAVTQAHAQRRPTIVPALLNAWAIHAAMQEFRSM